MIDWVKRQIVNMGKRFGADIRPPFPLANEKPFKRIYDLCAPYTKTSVEKMYSLYKSVEYIVKNDIKGDFVECGVEKGGSCMVIAMTLKSLGVKRTIWMYDTYQGMMAPSRSDTNNYEKMLKEWKRREDRGEGWCRSSLSDVKGNMKKTRYTGKVNFVKGMVEKTIPGKIPKKIALLRLDTDWYDSTMHELQHMYPLLSQRGVLIIDDYGLDSGGAKRAVDSYFKKNKINMLLHWEYYYGRTGLK